MKTIFLAMTLAVSARAADVKTHEAAEDKARTVPGGASLGVKACHDDIEKFCKGVLPGEGRLGACLKRKLKKLSKPCRKYAQHGGKAHVDEALLDIDRAAAPAAAAPAATEAPKKP